MKAKNKATTNTGRGKAKTKTAQSTRNSTTQKSARKKTVRKTRQDTQPQVENIIERVSDGFVAFDAELNYIYVNKSGGELLGRKPEDLIGKNYWKEYPEAKGTPFADAYVRALETQEPIVLEDYYEPFGRWFENRIYPSADGLSIFFTEITERKRAEFLLADEKNILEMIARGEPLEQILEEITRKIESQTRGMLCTILLLDPDGVHIRHGAAPSMEETFIRAIDGQPIGPKAGSCGTAAYRKEAVFVSDIKTDPLWADYREAALAHDLRACWSTPILSRDGFVLGTFAMYYREPRSPKPSDLRLIDIATRLTAIALEREHSGKSFQDSQEQLTLAIRSANVGLWDWDLQTNKVRYSLEWKSQLGYEDHEISNDFSEWENRVHPDDLKRALATTLDYIKEPYPNYENEFRMQHKDGSYRWILAQASLVNDDRGKPIRMIGSHIDITDRKQAEQARRESEEMFLTIFHETPVSTLLSTIPDGRILNVNDAYLRLTGFKRKEEVLGKSIDELGLTYDVETQERILQEFRANGMVNNAEMIFSDTNGQERTALVGMSPINIDGNTFLLSTSLDITERKQAEKERDKALDLFRKIFSLSPVPTTLSSLFERKIVDVNEATERLLGYSRDELVGKQATAIDYWANGEERQKAFEILREQGRISGYEFEFKTKSGKTGHAVTFAEIIEQAGDRYVLSKIIDITERRQAEEQVRYQANLIENVSDAILATDDKQVIISWNRGAEKLYGWKMEEVVGKPVRDVVRSEFTDAQREESIRELEESGAFRVEVLQYHRNGNPIWVEGNTISLHDDAGLLKGFVSINRDITGRKQADEKNMRHLNYLTALQDIDRAITSTFEMQTSLKTLISRAVSLLQVDAAAILLINAVTNSLEFGAGDGFRTTDVHTASVKLGESYAGRAVLERRMVQIRNLTDEPGNLFLSGFFAGEDFVSYYGIPLIVKGNAIGVLEVYNRSLVERDQIWLDFLNTLAGQAAIAIENAQLWEKTQRHTRELELRVAQRTEELYRTNLELQHANRAKDEFLANMSHELRTPLNSVLGLSESLLEQRRDPLSQHQQKSLRTIESSGRHLLALIDDILDISKIEAGKMDYYPEVIRVAEVCRSSLAFVRSQAVKKSIDLIYDEGGSAAEIYADPQRLKQILVNLLTNAVKFTPERGQVTLQSQTDAERDLVTFSVIDNGVGISSDDLKRLFQPFTQVDSSLNRQQEGAGLGLTLVSKLTDLHGGSVSVESEVGKGSRFTVNLPWRQEIVIQKSLSEHVKQSPTDHETEKPGLYSIESLTPGKVLLVEDNLSNVLTTADYLESSGYEVVVANNGLEAIELAEKEKPDIILMDIQMPEMDGLEAIRRLRAKPEFASVPIIALTALAMPGDRERCLEAGANEYLSKPVSLKGLVKTIGELLA